VTKIKKTVNVQ